LILFSVYEIMFYLIYFLGSVLESLILLHRCIKTPKNPPKKERHPTRTVPEKAPQKNPKPLPKKNPKNLHPIPPPPTLLPSPSLPLPRRPPAPPILTAPLPTQAIPPFITFPQRLPILKIALIDDISKNIIPDPKPMPLILNPSPLILLTPSMVILYPLSMLHPIPKITLINQRPCRAIEQASPMD
jgi:hypothetical protein